jgi:hypothetical protein
MDAESLPCARPRLLAGISVKTSNPMLPELNGFKVVSEVPEEKVEEEVMFCLFLESNSFLGP